jgi:hypothetical protein
VDFVDALASGDAINTYTVTAIDSAGNDVTATMISNPGVAGTEVYALFDGGDHGKTYKITYGVDTVNGEHLEEDVVVQIFEE